MGGGKSGTTTSSIKIPREVRENYKYVFKLAKNAAQAPFEPYGGEFVAPINERQLAGMEGIDRATGLAQPYLSQAGEMTLGASGPVAMGSLGQTEIEKYLNPYTKNVVEATQRAQAQANQQQYNQLFGNAITQGAFGGDRAGVGAANLAYQQNLANQQQIADLYRTGYTQALDVAGQQQARDLAARQMDQARALEAAKQYAGVGTQAQESALQGAQAQIGAGTLEQQTKQALDTAQFQQFLQQKGYPFQIAQFLANIALGIGSASGSTQTTTQPYSFFSDRRMKEDIKAVGKTFDGQNIYSYKYKGDPATHMGLIAQEVERHHPEAVGEAEGMKTVNYDAATRHAARRGHFYRGGLVSEGGAVHRASAGLGYARGGFPVGDLAALLESHRAMYGGLGGDINGPATGPYAGLTGPYGADISPLNQYQLRTPGEAPKLPEPELKGLLSYAGQAADIYSKFGGGSSPRGETDPNATEAKEPRPAGGTTTTTTTPTSVEAPAPEASSEPGLFQRGYNYLFGRADGGRVGYAGGGLLPYSTTYSYIPQAVLEDKDKPELKTPTAPGGQGQSDFQNLLGMGSSIASIASLFAGSDRRMKEDIRPVGKTFDGQTVYSYRYKGEPGVQMGLIAQEVEHHHPDAVAHDHRGLKMVNYARATEDAAERGKFYSGGLVRKGYGDGGTPTDEELEKVISQSVPPGFGSAVADVMRREGGLNPNDAGRGMTNRGINAQANPGVNVADLTEDQARNIYLEKYYKPVVTEQMNPAMQNIAFDTSVLMGPETAQRLVAQAQNDPQTLLRLRDQRLREIAKNPEKAPYLGAWENRSQDLANQFGLVREGLVPPSREPKPLERTVDRQSFVPPIGVSSAELQTGPSRQAGLAPKNEVPGFMEDPGYWLRRNQDWLVPLLTGVGTMASSPSRYLGSAILQGIGGAAQAYPAAAQSAAETERIRAETSRSAIPKNLQPFTNYDVRTGTYRSGPGYTLFDNEGNIVTDPRAASSPNRPEGEAPSVASVVVGGQEPLTGGGRPEGSLIDPQIQDVAARDLNSLRVTMGAEDKDYQSEPMMRAAQAQDARPNFLTLTKVIANIPKEDFFLRPGAGSAGLTAAADAFNSLVARFGGKEIVKPEDLANQQEFEKLIARIKDEGVRSGNQTAVRAYDEIARGFPSYRNSPEALPMLMADILVTNQKDIDRGALYQQYRDYIAGQPGGGAYFAPKAGRGLEAEFARVFNPGQYIKAKEALAKAIGNTAGTDPETGKPMSYAEYIIKYGSQFTPERRKQVEEMLGSPGGVHTVLRYLGA